MKIIIHFTYHHPSIVNYDQQLFETLNRRIIIKIYRMWCRVVRHNLVVTDACQNITGGGHVEDSLLHPRSLCCRQLFQLLLLQKLACICVGMSTVPRSAARLPRSQIIKAVNEFSQNFSQYSEQRRQLCSGQI